MNIWARAWSDFFTGLVVTKITLFSFATFWKSITGLVFITLQILDVNILSIAVFNDV